MNRTVSLVTILQRFILAVAALYMAPTLALAQSAGVAISPGVIEETLDPGIQREYDLEINNLTDNQQEYFLFTRNIRSVSPGGVPVFAEDWEKTGFELVDWVSLSTSTVRIGAGQKVTVPFSLSVPDNAAPGSHFGGVFISAEPPDMEASGAAVGYQVANIISIRVSGDVVEEASIRQFSTNKFLYSAQDVDFNVRIENSGNVLVRPVGPLEVYNALGKRVGEVAFNESRAGVFPNDTREFTELNWLGDGPGFGRYEAILSANYGEQGAIKTMSSTVTFWILPINIIGPALGILAVVLLVTVFGVRMYVRRALAHATAGRRMVRKRRQTGPSATLLVTVSVLVVLALFLLVMVVLFS